MIALLLAAALFGPPAPADPAVALLEARLAEVRRVADGTFTDAALIGAASAFDIWSTERCITRNPRCYEANPLGADSGSSRIALKAGVYPLKVGVSYGLRRLGHHGWARVAALVFSAIDVAVGIHNLDKADDR